MCCSFVITAQASGTNFVDVPKDAWYYEAVMKVVEEGLFNGTDESHFSPEGTLNRAMFVTVMWRYDGQPSGYIPQFSDVAEGSFFYDAVGWASVKGLVNGVSQDLFAPGSNIIREQMVVLMYRYAVYKGMEMDGMEDLNKYSDGTLVSAYAQEAVSWALGNGLLMTRDGMICPWDNATRADAAFLWAGFLNMDSDRPSDSDDQNGADGKSAYELAVANGYKGTEAQWLASLAGAAGKDGEDGIDGEAGVSVVGAYINDEMHMILIMSDGSEIDAGYVGVEQKAEMVTVTFVDRDGTVLKTEVIEKGSNATAPQVAARKGYLFTGWDRDFEEVTENMEVRAQYGIARNQLYFDDQQNGDGTLAVTLTACGDVNFYGLSLEIGLRSAVGLRYNGAAALANGAIVNYKNGKILLAYTNVTGRDNEAETPLLEIIFDITGSAQKLEPAVSAVDIFDEEYRDETYHISNSSYER